MAAHRDPPGLLRGPALGHAVLLAVVGVLGACRCCAALPPPSALVNCLREGQRNQLTTYKDFVDGTPTRLTLAAGWWSSKQQVVDLSIITGLTVSRLDQLQAQCQAWRGSLVASVYLVLYMPPGHTDSLSDANRKAIEDAAAQMDTVHAALEADPDACSLDMMLLVETVSEASMQWMLPINVLRNHALMAARSQLVAMVDVDLLPSAGLAEWLLQPGNLDWLQQECSQRKVFVLPAFETAPLEDTAAAHAVARQAAAQDKAGLLRMMDKGQVWQFALKLFKQGHNCTDYPRWFVSKGAYGPIGWTKDYEPWFIADRSQVPLYDSVFRGYGWNKVTQVTNTHAQGFKFMVHPTGFLVHRQHDYSKAGSLYQASKKQYEAKVKADKAHGDKDTSLAGTTHKFRNRVLEHLEAGSYQPAVDEGVATCLASLPWWRDGLQLQQQRKAAVAVAARVQVAAALGGSSSSSKAAAAGGSGSSEGGDAPYRKHVRARIWLKKRQRHHHHHRPVGGPGKSAL